MGVALALALLPVSGLLAAGPASADEASMCSALSTPVRQFVDPATQASLLTTAATAAGAFTQQNGVLFLASKQPAAGLVEVHEIVNPRNGNHVYMVAGNEATNAVTAYRMVDNGVVFYAAPKSLSCTVPVQRYRYKAYHRAAPGDVDAIDLVDLGWLWERTSFHAALPGTTPPPTGPTSGGTPRTDRDPSDPTFSIAVMPDTQQEVWSPDARFKTRSDWLVSWAVPNADLRFVTHTGDVVNWDTDNHDQYEWASRALQPLTDAGIPWSLSNGNHDNMATGPGGAARDSHNTRTLFRDTETFNWYFTAEEYGAVTAAFEAGKVDNIYSRFDAGGLHWGVLNLEMYPRAAAVEWARQVVASYPHDNVILAIHYYLEADGSIAQGSGYGETSGQHVFDNLVSQYPNIKMVFSGHTGIAASRTDTGVNGNTVYSFVAAIHSNKTNPVRMVYLDTSAGTIRSTIVAPSDNAQDWQPYNLTQTGVSWVR